jgi:hypothetical protein
LRFIVRISFVRIVGWGLVFGEVTVGFWGPMWESEDQRFFWVLGGIGLNFWGVKTGPGTGSRCVVGNLGFLEEMEPFFDVT